MPSPPGSVPGVPADPGAGFRRVLEILERAARCAVGRQSAAIGASIPWRVRCSNTLKSRIRPYAPDNPRGDGADYQSKSAPRRSRITPALSGLRVTSIALLASPATTVRPVYGICAELSNSSGRRSVALFNDRPQQGAPQWSDPRHVHPDRDAVARGYGLHTCSTKPDPLDKTAFAFPRPAGGVDGGSGCMALGIRAVGRRSTLAVGPEAWTVFCQFLRIYRRRAAASVDAVCG